jgi:hypothetical protein
MASSRFLIHIYFHSYLFSYLSIACYELRNLILKQWDFYQKKASVLSFPSEYVGEGIVLRSNFHMKAKCQFLAHVEGLLDDYQDARAMFERSSTKTTLILRSSSEPNSSLKEDSKEFTLSDYWLSVSCVCPELRFIVRILQSCSASESCVERLFSDEANIHDKIHNALDPEYVNAKVRIKWNVEFLKRKKQLNCTAFADEVQENESE